MIILDTNVLSDVMRNRAPVLAWLVEQERDDLRLAATTVTEIVYGLERLPAGRRRDLLSSDWAALLSTWSDRVLPVSLAVSHEAGVILAEREGQGRPISLADAQIAATARARRAALATRNTKDFEGLGIDLVDPWAGD